MSDQMTASPGWIMVWRALLFAMPHVCIAAVTAVLVWLPVLASSPRSLCAEDPPAHVHLRGWVKWLPPLLVVGSVILAFVDPLRAVITLID